MASRWKGQEKSRKLERLAGGPRVQVARGSSTIFGAGCAVVISCSELTTRHWCWGRGEIGARQGSTPESKRATTLPR